MPPFRSTLAVLFGVLSMPAGALAHAILLQSQPAASSSVAAGKLEMTFSYNSRIDKARSRLTLIGPDRRQSVLKVTQSGSPDILQTSAELTLPGAYVVRWQVLAVDGHITRGDVPFTVTDH